MDFNDCQNIKKNLEKDWMDDSEEETDSDCEPNSLMKVYCRELLKSLSVNNVTLLAKLTCH